MRINIFSLVFDLFSDTVGIRCVNSSTFSDTIIFFIVVGKMLHRQHIVELKRPSRSYLLQNLTGILQYRDSVLEEGYLLACGASEYVREELCRTTRASPKSRRRNGNSFIQRSS
jgi:hypothetical protein